MAGNAASRIEKWKKKLSGDARKKAYDAQKVMMVKQEAEATIDLVKIEQQIKLMVQGEPITLIPYYIIFGKEIYKKQNKFKAQSLLNEIMILEQKWESRGLDPVLLDKIKTFYVQPYIYITPFRLDISLLDGPHILS